MRKLFWLTIVGFLLFFMVTSPVEAGNIVKNISIALSKVFVEAAKSFSEFLRTVF